jgi:beta-glucosidase
MNHLKSTSIKATLLLSLILYCFGSFAQDKTKQIWFDEKQPAEKRINALVKEMTLEEKVSQLSANNKAIPRLGVQTFNWWNEALHGVARGAKATIFPQPIGMAATFDNGLVHNVASAISDEGRAINNEMIKRGLPMGIYMGLTYWSPNINIFRDPRWGRGHETYGEDPYLTGLMGKSFIQGLQGNDPKYLKSAACAKHFAVHSGPEELRHSFNVTVSPKNLYQTYLPAFKVAVDAGVAGVMCAYNRVDDLPCCGSNVLLKDILVDKWGFKGYIVSDCGALRDFTSGHKVTKSSAEAAALALKNGVNINCGSVYPSLTEAVNLGLVTEKEIDDALIRTLEIKFKLGMFDEPSSNPYNSLGLDVINSKKNQDLALKVAEESIVLLKNKDNLLPLKKDIGQIFITGPLSNHNLSLMGNYHGMNENMVTISEGIVGKVSSITRIEYREGALMNDPRNKTGGLGIANSSEVTVAVVGLSLLLEGEEGETLASDVKGDNISMRLPSSQVNLIKRLATDIHKNGKKLVVVVCAGSPLILDEIADAADALVYAWYPGEKGGLAVANVLFGDVSPSGKLPITFPKSVEDIPAFENYDMAGRTYRFMEKTPMYPFGYGLSYNNFEISDVKLDKAKIRKSENNKLSLTLKNNGNTKADEVLQLYVSLKDKKLSVPISELKSFKRVCVEGGKSENIEFEIPASYFTYVDVNGETKNFRGKAEITIGNSSPGVRSAELGAKMKTIALEIL